MVVALHGVVVLQAQAAPGPLPEPRFAPPPRLAESATERTARKAATDFPKLRAARIEAAEALLARPPELPEGPASWIFYYANPETGQRLEPLSATEHKDPVSGEIFTDARTCAAYRFLLHNRAEAGALTLAWAYADTGDDRYAAGARRILHKLAEDYPGYPDRVDRWGHTGDAAPLGARRNVQALDEAFGIIPLAKAYDLTRMSPVFSKEDRVLIEKNLFRGTAETLLRFNQGMSNHQTWYNAGLLAIASVLEDAALVKKVLSMPGGFYDQLERSVGQDGLWYEGAIAYHFYALQAMIEIVEAGRRLGLPLDQEEKFRKLFTGPLHATYPDGSFPVIHDSDRSNIGSYGRFWKWAWETWQDPIFAQALAQGDRDKLAALLGAQARTQWPLVRDSEVLPDAGLAILRRGQGERAVTAFLDYGQHGGEHGHFDKLNLLLFANGREWLLDPGRLTYSHKEYKTWVKTTAAHNTLVLNTENQAAATGRLLYLDVHDGFVAAGVTCDTAYPGTTLTRHVLLTENFLVDVFEAHAPASSQMDLFFHAAADNLTPASSLLRPNPGSLGTMNGYQHFTDTLAYLPQENSQWNFSAGSTLLAAHLIAEPGERIFTTRSIGYTIGQRVPTLVRRRQAAQTRFVTLFDLSGQGDAIQHIESPTNALLAFTMGQKKVVIRQDAEGRLVLESPPE